MRRIFTVEQRKVILQNENVRRCSDRSIGYKPAFKEKALKLYKDGLAAVAIFELSGFDLDVIGKRTPNRLMHQWRKPEKSKRQFKVTPESLERRKNESVKKLRHRVAYLEAENHFLVKLRAGKRKSS